MSIQRWGQRCLRLTSSTLDMDWAEIEAKIVRFIRDYVKKSGTKGIVLGLSGGVDSSTVAALSSKAVGGKNVLGLLLPEEETRSKTDIQHAKTVAERFGLRSQICDITKTLEAFYSSIPVFDPVDYVCKGNIKARTRMIHIYYYANKLNLLVCGSSDKSETMMGYFTKWGDVAADISPLMDLYKTQVLGLARQIGVPETIIKKPPSPALWPGQTAEKELGVNYGVLDLVLYGLERFTAEADIAKQLGISEELVKRIEKRWLQSEHKRRMLLTSKLQYRTVGMDFRIRRG